MENFNKFIKIIVGISCFFLGVIITYLLISYVSPNKDTFITKKDVTITDTGIAESVEKVYDAVVVVTAYEGEQVISSGTGFVYKTDNSKAYILTNAHVITNADKITVRLTNDSVIEAKLEGLHDYEDIAVLTINKKDSIHKAKIGKSDDLRVGDTAFTVGAPLDSLYSWTVTRGIISGKDRMLEVSYNNSNTPDYVMKVIQTDAAINSGNSGGPLCNANGEVIGITSLKLIRSGVEGMGFAIPIEKAVNTAESILKGETSKTPYLGIGMLNLSSARYYTEFKSSIENSKLSTGVILTDVEKNKPAHKAGLAKNDIIIELNDEKIPSIAYLRYELYRYKVGDTITVKYVRDGKTKTTKIILESNLNMG